ncbi:hypothetical protein ColTof4_03484 [Colletotrichum tofieldiae]|nr:hypothetical protein ColTof3_13090 [Colletotrichum tofieldiae]GKT71061.1 hypothetical protein ColTof4_03484 [Colletotrichum tofieldiae]GKT94022.1 hypothetical protein Ct61P_11872 [Colletotrichum tofieldiae]
MAMACLLFFTLTIFHIHTRSNTSDRGRHNCATSPICAAFHGTIEDVFEATLNFSVALHIATLDFRTRSATRSDANSAKSLCTYAGLACMTLWHMRAEVARQI